MNLKTAKQIIDGFPAHLRKKHRGKREVSPKDIEDAQVDYLATHLRRYFNDGLEQGRSSAERPYER